MGQKQCPWSKSFLLEAVCNRLSTDNFLQVLESIIIENGLQLYTTIYEVEFLLNDTMTNRLEMELEQRDDHLNNETFLKKE